ncbi:AraC family transcriptional regulator [Fundicoccus culcitae]|uniref:AraC family transcriptional regulator n=1 Tax=Fundicoccus culcitae TaxID=2969821 RepID=A0ABY5P3K2_9LACT|nr:AraC family transcriptional regulator [Fundicoccus culcitae]UUX33000.1 AraC family transcriptional regulator [Fundicoccus culcitae]
MNYFNSQTFNLDILYAFDAWNDEGNHNGLHHHDFFEISLILEGEAEYLIEGREQTIYPGMALLFNPGQQHAEKQKAGTQSHQLHIGINNFLINLQQRNHMPNQQVIINLTTYYQQIYDRAWSIIREFNEQKADYQLYLKALTMELMILLARQITENNQATASNLTKTEQRQLTLVEHAIDYMKKNYQSELTLELIARELLVSPTYLSRIFKEKTSMSVINYLISIRLANAAERLTIENSSIKDIAMDVGYQDVYHFSKQFKKHYGIAPSKYQGK